MQNGFGKYLQISLVKSASYSYASFGVGRVYREVLVISAVEILLFK